MPRSIQTKGIHLGFQIHHQTSPEVQNMGISGHIKRIDVLEKNLKKKKIELEFVESANFKSFKFFQLQTLAISVVIYVQAYYLFTI